MLQILLIIFYTLLFILLIYKLQFFSIERLSRKLIISIFILKIFFGIGLGLIYAHYYPEKDKYADTYKYFNASYAIYESFFINKIHFIELLTRFDFRETIHLKPYVEKIELLFRDQAIETYNFSDYQNHLWMYVIKNHIIIRYNAILRFFSFGNYYVHVVFSCFLSLVGLTALFKVFNSGFINNSIPLKISFFFIPSVLFWGSGVLKEPILLFAIGMFLYILHFGSIKGFTVKYIMLGLFVIYLLTYNQGYMFFILLPCFIAYLWVLKTDGKYCSLKFLFTVIIYFVLVFNIKWIFPEYDFIKILSFHQHNLIEFAQGMKPSSIITLHALNNEIRNLIVNIPYALYNCFFRPHIFEAKSIMMLFSALENLAFLIIILIALPAFNFKVFLKSPLLQFSFYFTLLLMILIGTLMPISGSIVRYKISSLPFLLLIFLLSLNKEKLYKILPFTKKVIFFR